LLAPPLLHLPACPPWCCGPVADAHALSVSWESAVSAAGGGHGS